MSGLGTLLGKELTESWRTRRLPVVVGLFLFVGILSPLTARYIREIVELAAGEALPLPIPDPTLADSVLQLQKNLGQFGALAAIVLAMGSVAAEKERGTAAFLLTKPVTRGAFLGAKLVSLAAVLAIATAVASVVAWAYTAVLFEPPDPVGWAAMTVLAWIALLVWTALTFAASALTRSSAAAAGVGVVALLVVSMVSAIPAVGRWLPPALDPPGRALAIGGPVDAGALAAAVAGSVALGALAVLVAWLAFRREEL